jgi:hypothetical protein
MSNSNIIAHFDILKQLEVPKLNGDSIALHNLQLVKKSLPDDLMSMKATQPSLLPFALDSEPCPLPTTDSIENSFWSANPMSRGPAYVDVPWFSDAPAEEKCVTLKPKVILQLSESTSESRILALLSAEGSDTCIQRLKGSEHILFFLTI